MHGFLWYNSNYILISKEIGRYNGDNSIKNQNGVNWEKFSKKRYFHI